MNNLIHEVNEDNFEQERYKGELELQKKFDLWDKLGKLNISIDEFKAKAAYLLRDPTIWAYATLNDKQNLKLRSWYYQDKIMNDRHRFIHVTAANQIGKTWGPGVIKSAHHVLHVNNASAMIISRSEDQSKGILDEIKWMFQRARLPYSHFMDEVHNRFEIHLKSPDNIGTSVIRVFPPTPAILSFPATYVLMDETGFWEQKYTGSPPIDYYQQCVEPRTNATKNWKHPFLTMGQIVSITNPNGQDGLAWWLFNNPKYHNYTYNWLACPNNTLKEYEEVREVTNPTIFASTHAAQYIMASGGFITLDQYNRFSSYNTPLVIPQGSNLFLGGDFASEDPLSKNTDWGVIYGVTSVKNEKYPMYPRVRVVYFAEFPPGTKREDIYSEIERVKNLPGVSILKFAYDKVGVSDSVKRDLVGRGVLNESQIELLTYSLPNKSDIYLNFQNLFCQDMIEGSSLEKLKTQLLALKVEKPTGSPHIKVHHKTEGVKDDHPDALANACYTAKLYNSYFTSSFISKSVPLVKDDVLSKGIELNRKFEDWVKLNSVNSF